jgi:MinD superfamily P-loop ATPase
MRWHTLPSMRGRHGEGCEPTGRRLVCREEIKQDRWAQDQEQGAALDIVQVSMCLAFHKARPDGDADLAVVSDEELAAAGGNALLDAPPGTSSPVVATVRGVDFTALVTEPT